MVALQLVIFNLFFGFSVEQKEELTPTELIVKNEADYDAEFITEIRELEGYNKIELKDSLLIFDNTDTTYFPTFLKKHESYIFTAKQNDLAIAVTIKRINYTSIDYRIEMVEFGKSSHQQNGEAHLSPFFFMGSEIDENAKTGNSYPVTEYTKEEGDCYISLRLGYSDELKSLMCGLIKNCNEKIADIDLENYPKLHLK